MRESCGLRSERWQRRLHALHLRSSLRHRDTGREASCEFGIHQIGYMTCDLQILFRNRRPHLGRPQSRVLRRQFGQQCDQDGPPILDRCINIRVGRLLGALAAAENVEFPRGIEAEGNIRG